MQRWCYHYYMKNSNGHHNCIPTLDDSHHTTKYDTAAQIGIKVGERSMILARINAKETPHSEFHVNYKAPLVPTVITNIPQEYNVQSSAMIHHSTSLTLPLKMIKLPNLY